MFGKNDIKPVSEYHHSGERRKERNPMNIKSVIAVLTAAALLGVSVTSCLAFRPDDEPDAASPAGVTQPMEEEPSNEPIDNDENAPETPVDTPEEEDTAAAEDTGGGEDNDLTETEARPEANSGNQNTVTPAAPTAKDSGAVQIADQQTGNDSQSQDSGSGDSQDGGQQDHNTCLLYTSRCV